MMKDDMFSDVLKSVTEAKAILEGKAKPSRIFVIDELDVKAIRQQFKLSQVELERCWGSVLQR